MLSFRVLQSTITARWNTAPTVYVALAFLVLAIIANSRVVITPVDEAGTETVAAAIGNDDNSIYALSAVWNNAPGDRVQLSSLAGRVQVMAMVYTNCHSTCPLIIAELKRIEASLKDVQRGGVAFVLVSLDPERDTPTQLSAWAASLGLDPAHWTLLSSNESATRELAAALNVRYQAQSNGEFAHTNGLAVLDRRGNLIHQQLGLNETAASIQVVQSLLN